MALLPISIVLGVLCGLWFQITVWIPWLVAWVGFAAWASFFYAGGDNSGFAKSLSANVAGMLQGSFFFWLWVQYGSGSMIFLSVIIGVLCFLMTFEGNIALLSAIPGQFVGASGFFGNLCGHDGAIWATLVSTFVCMLIGNLFGIVSVKITNMVSKKIEE